MTAIEDQPAPIANDQRPSWELVIEDMQERHKIGIERYGTPLQPRNGRDSIVDAYQEILDAAVYLRNEIEERRQDPKTQSRETVESRLEKIAYDLEKTTSPELKAAEQLILSALLLVRVWAAKVA